MKDGAVVYADTIDHTSPRVPHPDLEKALKKLVPMLADANKLRVWRDDIKIMPKLRKVFDNKEGERVLELWDQHLMESIEVIGISLQGDLETGSVVITGKRCGALNSPKISFNGDTYGFETELKEACEKIIEEVYQYCFKNKSTTPELFGDQEEAA